MRERDSLHLIKTTSIEECKCQNKLYGNQMQQQQQLKRNFHIHHNQYSTTKQQQTTNVNMNDHQLPKERPQCEQYCMEDMGGFMQSSSYSSDVVSYASSLSTESSIYSSSSSTSSSSSSSSSSPSHDGSFAPTSSPSIGVNLRVTGQCSQGGRKYMEDYFSVAYQQAENAKELEYAFIGIYDGHGGAEAATFAKEHLMMEIINQKLFWSDSDQDVLRAIREGFIATHYAMWRDQANWPKTANGLLSTAGTTATIAFIRRENIYIGHVGDSGIVLGYQNEDENFWRARQLTTDHKPESLTERTRIMRSGGKVVVKSGVPRVVWNRPRNPLHRGPLRRTTPVDEIPFLAVARSLGDLWSYNSERNEFVVSPDPDVKVIKINPKTFRCLIFGTDGLWNVVTAQDAVDTVREKELINERLIAQRGDSPAEGSSGQWTNPSKGLVEQALKTWSSKKMRADNTSVVTVILYPPTDSSGGVDVQPDNLPSSYGLEYTQLNTDMPTTDNASTYQQVAEKYLPPSEFRNFNYYEADLDMELDERHLPPMTSEEAAALEPSIMRSNSNSDIMYWRSVCEKLEDAKMYDAHGNDTWAWDGSSMGCGSGGRVGDFAFNSSVSGLMDSKTSGTNVPLRHVDITMASEVEQDDDDNDDDEGDEDEEDVEDDDDVDDDFEAEDDVDDVDDDENVEEEEEELETVPSVANYVNYINDTSNSLDASAVTSATEEVVGCYMNSFAESYNSLLNEQMSQEASTSNSSTTYQSVSGSAMHEILQEQQRYQQECMSEEDGYSLTKLETRREQQRCTAVQTFKIFQQQQQQQQLLQQHQQQQQHHVLQQQLLQHSEELHNYGQLLANGGGGSAEQSHFWYSRFAPSTSGSANRYLSYQHQHHQQHHHHHHPPSASSHPKPLELNSLLQQEREEEQQVALERLEMQRKMAQQHQPSVVELAPRSPARHSPLTTTWTVAPQSHDRLANDQERATPQVQEEEEEALIEEYLDEELISPLDETVQINEISSSSAAAEGGRFTPPASDCRRRGVSCKRPIATVVEKIEKIEILREKPKLVIEATPPSAKMRRRCNGGVATTAPAAPPHLLPEPSTAHCRQLRNATAGFPKRVPQYHNIPKENQRMSVTASEYLLGRCQRYAARPGCSPSLASIPSAVTTTTGGSRPLSASMVAMAPNRRQLRSAGIVDYSKRTLRTRNSLSKDMKAKSTMTSGSLKRPPSARYLRSGPDVSAAGVGSLSTTSSPKRMRTGTPSALNMTSVINLRSRQVAAPPMATPKVCHKMTSTAPLTPMRYHIERRNLRSLSTRIGGVVREGMPSSSLSSTSAPVNPTYSKSTRLQSSSGNALAAPPPSPKLINAAAAVAAATRARSLALTMKGSGATVVRTVVFNKRTSPRSSVGNDVDISVHAGSASTAMTLTRGRVSRRR